MYAKGLMVLVPISVIIILSGEVSATKSVHLLATGAHVMKEQDIVRMDVSARRYMV